MAQDRWDNFDSRLRWRKKWNTNLPSLVVLKFWFIKVVVSVNWIGWKRSTCTTRCSLTWSVFRHIFIITEIPYVIKRVLEWISVMWAANQPDSCKFDVDRLVSLVTPWSWWWWREGGVGNSDFTNLIANKII